MHLSLHYMILFYMNHSVNRSSAIFLLCQVISVSLWSLVPVWMNGNNRSVHLCWNGSCKCERSWIVWRRSPGTRKTKPLRWRSCVQNLPPCRSAWTRWNGYGVTGVSKKRHETTWLQRSHVEPNLSKNMIHEIHKHIFLTCLEPGGCINWFLLVGIDAVAWVGTHRCALGPQGDRWSFDLQRCQSLLFELGEASRRISDVKITQISRVGRLMKSDSPAFPMVFIDCLFVW